MKIGDNLKLLRKRAEKSQEDVANDLGLNRSTYSGYENGVAQPNIENLIALSNYYKLSIDSLLSENFLEFTPSDWNNFDKNWKDKAAGSSLRVLTSMVNEDNEDLIELVTQKASAGYVSAYADLEFISELPTLRLPFLSKNKKYRTFPISGDSMPPVVDGSFVVGEFVQDWTTIKSGEPYILVTKNEGILFKLLYNELENSKSFLLVSTNSFYKPYQVAVEEVHEVWRFVNYISSVLPALKMADDELSSSIRSIQIDMHRLLNGNKS
jgi:transcriptional regulator with XRE-family HTH domain